jgi:hypothetical protein
MALRATTQEFKDKIYNKYNGKVEILGEYNGGLKSIDFVYHCEKHGDKYSTMKAKNISSNKTFQPCDECMKENKRHRHMTPDELLSELSQKAKSYGGKLLDYKWVKSKHKYKFKCNNESHPIFEATHDSVTGNKQAWCPYCAGRLGDFQTEIEEIVKSKDGMLLSEYKMAYEYVAVKCNKHDYVWEITPANLRKGRWCYICDMPYSEKVAYDLLIENGYTVTPQYGFEDLLGTNGQKLRFDFAVSKGSLFALVEIDDNEHRYTFSDTSVRGKQRIEAQQRDIVKDEYCKNKSINLIRVDIDTYSKYYKSESMYKLYLYENLIIRLLEGLHVVE